jgi:hypothetical protein
MAPALLRVLTTAWPQHFSDSPFSGVTSGSGVVPIPVVHGEIAVECEQDQVEKVEG